MNYMLQQIISHNTPANYPVGLASGSCSSQVIGVCYVKLVVQNRKYESVKFSILAELVCDLILGEYFMDSAFLCGI